MLTEKQNNKVRNFKIYAQTSWKNIRTSTKKKNCGKKLVRAIKLCICKKILEKQQGKYLKCVKIRV